MDLHSSELETTKSPETPDFSLVLGGPLFQLFRRTHLSGNALELLWRRIVVITLFAWLPLLFLSWLDHGSNAAIKISFLRDIEGHVRFLIALPWLIAAELVVHRRISPLVRRFVERCIVTPEDLLRYNAAVKSALQLRNSVALETMLLVLVYTVGRWIWANQLAMQAATWYARPEAGRLHLTLAGYWYGFVSIPIFQFILLRWYLRLGIWFRFLWQVSRLKLSLTAAHPDRAGGIGFLGKSSYAFTPILGAQGALLAGLIATRVLYDGQSLLSFKMDAAGLVGFLVLGTLGPLVVFTPQMEEAKRQGRAEYGLLASRYLSGFEEKWIRTSTPQPNELLGTSDIQSLADLGNSYSVVSDMRIVPFGLDDIKRLAVAAAAPLLPLMLTVLSPEELLKRLVSIIF